MYNKVAKVNKNQIHFHLYFCEFSSVISNCFRLQTSFYYCRIFTSLLIIKSLQALLILYYLWILFLLNYPQFFILFLRHQQHLSKHCLTSYFTYVCSTILHISSFISLSNIIPPFMLLISSLLTLSHCYLQTLVAHIFPFILIIRSPQHSSLFDPLSFLSLNYFFILRLLQHLSICGIKPGSSQSTRRRLAFKQHLSSDIQMMGNSMLILIKRYYS